MKVGFCHFNENGNNRTYSIPFFDHLVMIQQDPNAIELGHGSVVWDASIIFCKFIEYNANDYSLAKLSNKTVIELGSGCGLGGITMMLRGAEVTFTDLEKVISSLTERNAMVILYVTQYS